MEYKSASPEYRAEFDARVAAIGALRAKYDADLRKAAPRLPALKALQEAFPQTERGHLRDFRDVVLRGFPLHLCLDIANGNIDGFGVHVIRCPNRGIIAHYINTGDTYNPTLLRNNASGAWRITTLGDFVEAFERRHGRAATENLSLY